MTLNTLTWFEQSDAFRHQGFLATDRADQFPRLGLQADAVQVDLQKFGQSLADGKFVRRNLGLLGKQNAVDVTDAIARLANPGQGQRKHLGRVPSAVRRIGIGKQFANISQGQGAQQGVRDRVQEHIGVAVPDQSVVKGDFDSAQPQGSARRQAMRIVSNPNACGKRGSIPQSRGYPARFTTAGVRLAHLIHP
jgi:hypothetical protein